MVEFFLLNSERGLSYRYDGRCDWFENFESACHFWIESSDSNLEASQVSYLKSIFCSINCINYACRVNTRGILVVALQTVTELQSLLATGSSFICELNVQKVNYQWHWRTDNKHCWKYDATAILCNSRIISYSLTSFYSVFYLLVGTVQQWRWMYKRRTATAVDAQQCTVKFFGLHNRFGKSNRHQPPSLII